MSGGANLALEQSTTQSSTDDGADSTRAVDGNRSGEYTEGSVTLTLSESNPYWEVDLGSMTTIDKVIVYNRTDDVPERLEGFTISILDGSRNEVYTQTGVGQSDTISFVNKDIGDLWIIGDTMNLGSQDGDSSISPRQSLYEKLATNGYTFTFTGHVATNTDGLPVTGADESTNLYHYHSCLPDIQLGDSVQSGFNSILSTAWASGRLATVKPENILIMLGSEDVTAGYDLENAYSRLEALVTGIYALPDIGTPQVFLSSISPNRQTEAERTNTIIFNEAVKNIVANFQLTGYDIHFVDQYTPLDDVFATTMGTSNYYPNAVGSTLMGETWFNAIQDKLIEPVEYDSAAEFDGIVSDFNGYTKYEFDLPNTGARVKIIAPETPAPHKPWLWRSLFWEALSSFNSTDLKLVDEGYYVVLVHGKVTGHPSGNVYIDEAYEYLTTEHGFSPKMSMAGMSRGNLQMFQWAHVNPDKVDSIYSDNGVCNVLSWPAGYNVPGNDSISPGDPSSWSSFKSAFGYTSDAEALLTKESPIDRLEPLAEYGIPILSICGDNDPAVPYEENDAILEERYLALGGEITVVVEEKGHSHGTEDPQIVLDFIRNSSSVYNASSVVTGVADNVTVDSASIGTYLYLVDGTYDVDLYWGTTDGGLVSSAWENSTSLGAWATGDLRSVAHTLSSLTPDTTYYYNVRARSASGDIWGDSQNFTTIETPLDNLLGRWKFDTGSGSIAADSAGNGNSATISGPSWVGGLSGSALDFGVASSARVFLPDNIWSTLDTEVTIALWVYGADSQPISDTIFRANNSAGQKVINMHLPWSDSKVYFDAGVNSSGGNDRLSYAANEELFKGQWNHWVFTKNTTTGVMCIYVNGEQVATSTSKTLSMAGITDARLGYGSYYGIIDDFMIFDIEYTNAEVLELYESYSVINGVHLAWLAKHELSGDDAGALQDSDNDGQLNWQEFIAGTDPNSRESRLKIKRVTKSGDSIDVSWDSVSGKTYTLWASSSLQDGSWSEVQSGILGVDEVETMIELTSEDGAMFYRIEVE